MWPYLLNNCILEQGLACGLCIHWLVIDVVVYIRHREAHEVCEEASSPLLLLWLLLLLHGRWHSIEGHLLHWDLLLLLGGLLWGRRGSKETLEEGLRAENEKRAAVMRTVSL